jgi:hypothetical protein
VGTVLTRFECCVGIEVADGALGIVGPVGTVGVVATAIGTGCARGAIGAALVAIGAVCVDLVGATCAIGGIAVLFGGTTFVGWDEIGDGCGAIAFVFDCDWIVVVG